jgi:uncharacterized membrane protein
MQTPHEQYGKDGFRLRGTQMSRVDGFSDVVFGFALTLLVVSLEVPKTFAELHNLLYEFLPFAVSFLLLMLIWHTHYKFFRRFGLHDTWTIWLNGMLLFFVLFYVYPLKFMFAAAFGHGASIEHVSDLRTMTLLYGGGFIAVYAIITLMYINAWRQREHLELTPVELRLARLYIWDEGGNVIIGLLSCLIALLLPPEKATLATMAYMLIGVHKSITGNKITQVRKSIQVADADVDPGS